MHKGRVISGFLKRRTITFPDVLTTRPTTDALKEALFNCLKHRFNLNFQEWSVIDAFAGSGALGIEAISLGSPLALFFEQNQIAYNTICKNIFNLNITNKATVLRVDVTKYRIRNLLHKLGNKVLVIMDPPYNNTYIVHNLMKKFITAFNGKELIITVETNDITTFANMIYAHVVPASGNKKVIIFHITSSNNFSTNESGTTGKLER